MEGGWGSRWGSNPARLGVCYGGYFKGKNKEDGAVARKDLKKEEGVVTRQVVREEDGTRVQQVSSDVFFQWVINLANLKTQSMEIKGKRTGQLTDNTIMLHPKVKPCRCSFRLSRNAVMQKQLMEGRDGHRDEAELAHTSER